PLPIYGEKRLHFGRSGKATVLSGLDGQTRTGMAEFMSTGSRKWHTVTRGSESMDPSLTVCSLSAKTIAIKHASTLITCGALLLRRTFLTEAVRKKAASPGSEMSTYKGASGEFR